MKSWSFSPLGMRTRSEAGRSSFDWWPFVDLVEHQTYIDSAKTILQQWFFPKPFASPALGPHFERPRSVAYRFGPVKPKASLPTFDVAKLEVKTKLVGYGGLGTIHRLSGRQGRRREATSPPAAPSCHRRHGQNRHC